ncbi:hypothetical protein A4S06_06870 [Erysipelotrichaceae bacterium MTC7]|nr:hypothetical protein A4S06_06870 [Erysipelotrichaceae bacterium MTC7]
MTNSEIKKEIQEAREAGHKALTSLEGARQHLESASTWGIFDMIGGGFFTGLMKHSRLDDASEKMEQAKYELQSFQKELMDLSVPEDFGLNIGGFLTFADFFFDGIVADWMVQSRISDARLQVSQAIEKIEQIMQDLDAWEQQVGEV